MKTDDLITALAQDSETRATPMARRLAIATAAACVLAAVALAASIGVRPDIWSALGTWRFDAKLVSVAAVLLGAWAAVRRLSRPEADQRSTLALLTAPVLVLCLALGFELATTPAASWGARAIGSNSRLCLVAIVALAIAPLAVLLATMRAGAPRSPSLAGAATGLLSGAIGAFFYAIHCPDDSPLFVALWYTPPVLAMTVIGALAGRSALRW
jgi:hypothetical protein